MENLGITKEQSDELVGKNITDPIIKMHLRETEVFMRALAKHFGEDEEQWGIIGLLHDIDWQQTKENPTEHCVKCHDILKEAGASEFLIESIISHGYSNEHIPALQDNIRKTKLHFCLAAAETLTGLIIASALVQPEKKLANVSFESLKKKFKSKGFAAKCDREIIMECEKAGISLDDFLQIGLTSLQGIASELNL